MLRLPALIFLLAAQPVAALTCAQQGTLSQAFRTAAASDTPYVLAAGTINRLGGQQLAPKEDLRGNRLSFTAKARFTGVRAGAGGLNQRFNEIITVNVQCVQNLCGSVPQGGFVAFLEQRGSSHILSTSICPTPFLHRDSPQARAEVRACLAGRCPR